jgi:hypothetical protein
MASLNISGTYLLIISNSLEPLFPYHHEDLCQNKCMAFFEIGQAWLYFILPCFDSKTFITEQRQNMQ